MSRILTENELSGLGAFMDAIYYSDDLMKVATIVEDDVLWKLRAIVDELIELRRAQGADTEAPATS